MPAVRWTDEEILAMNVEKIQLSHPGLCFVVPETEEDYRQKFPGLPPDMYPLLATKLGPSPVEETRHE